jgi:hypothetical protein
MSKPDWPNIKCDYVETTLTLAEVQAKWGIPRGTLSARSTRESWRDQKQQFAAKLAQIRQEKIIAKMAAEQATFQSNISKVATNQLWMILSQTQKQKHDVDPAKLLKLTHALAEVQRIAITAHGIGTRCVRAAPDDGIDAKAS